MSIFFTFKFFLYSNIHTITGCTYKGVFKRTCTIVQFLKNAEKQLKPAKPQIVKVIQSAEHILSCSASASLKYLSVPKTLTAATLTLAPWYLILQNRNALIARRFTY